MNIQHWRRVDIQKTFCKCICCLSENSSFHIRLWTRTETGTHWSFFYLELQGIETRAFLLVHEEESEPFETHEDLVEANQLRTEALPKLFPVSYSWNRNLELEPWWLTSPWFFSKIYPNRENSPAPVFVGKIFSTFLVGKLCVHNSFQIMLFCISLYPDVKVSPDPLKYSLNKNRLMSTL